MSKIIMTVDQLKAYTAQAVEKAQRTNTDTAKALFGGIAVRPNGTKHKGLDLETKDGRGLAFVRIQRALALAKGDFDLAANIAKGWRDETKFDSDDAVFNVLKAGNLTPYSLASGGVFITPNQYTEIVELLHAKAVTRQLPGVDFQTFNSGTLLVNAESGSGVTASWVGETRIVNASTTTFSQHQMTAKALKAVAPIKNALIRRQDSSMAADQYLLKVLQRDIAIAEDAAFIRSTSDGAYTPKGLAGWIHSDNQDGMNATKSTTTIKAELTNMISQVEGADVSIESGCWIMNSRQKAYIGNVSSTNDINIFQEINQANPTLKGYPVFVTSGIPNTLGGGTESEIYFVDASKIIIADSQNVTINASDTASYTDSTGTLVSAYDRDETVFSAQLETDIYLKYAKAGSMLTGVTYI